MKSFSWVCLIFIFELASAKGNHPAVNKHHAGKLENVYVVDLKGRPQIERKKEGAESAKATAFQKGEKIRGQAIIHTDAQSEIVIQLEPDVKIKIYPNSEVHFPMIHWEGGAIEEIILKSGRIRWQSTASSKIQLKSDLFDSIFPSGTFVIIYNPKTPQVELISLEGNIAFQEKNGEESVQLSSGKKVHFLGQLDDGEIAYDVLLQGRKIPKGHKSQVEDVSPEDIKNYSYEAEKKALELKAKKIKEAAVPKKTRKDEICRNPNGLFNECSWVCENNPKDQSHCRMDLAKVQCVRYRCNANGQWAERSEVERSSGAKICGRQPVVQACDY